MDHLISSCVSFRVKSLGASTRAPWTGSRGRRSQATTRPAGPTALVATWNLTILISSNVTVKFTLVSRLLVLHHILPPPCLPSTACAFSGLPTACRHFLPCSLQRWIVAHIHPEGSTQIYQHFISHSNHKVRCNFKKDGSRHISSLKGSHWHCQTQKLKSLTLFRRQTFNF